MTTTGAASLDTPRLVLRQLTASDATRTYADWLNDPEVNRYLETRHTPQTPQTCREHIEHHNSDPNSHLFGVFLRSDGRHIGNAKLGFVRPVYASGQVSLFIGDKSQWGKGLGSEIVSAITAFGFRDLGLHRLEAGCYEENLGSLRIFLRAGYAVEGFFKDAFLLDGRRQGCFWLGALNNAAR